MKRLESLFIVLSLLMCLSVYGSSDWSPLGRASSCTYPTVGEVATLVLLVQFQDVEFSDDPEYINDYFSRMLNEEGFSEEGATGSASDYFLQASNDLFHPRFDVFGPITLPYTRKYYGGNDSWGNDKNPHKMVINAMDILYEEGVDFDPYDNDADGVIDNVFLYFAGQGEASSSVADAVWPHTDWLSKILSTTKGYQVGNWWVDSYTCSSELIGKNMLDGIGTFVHEYSHVLGLPDFYNTISGTQSYTPGAYSILDRGTYNNNSRTPPTYSIFERNALGWAQPFNIEDFEDIEILPLLDSNQGYYLEIVPNKEYFFFENRQLAGWDSYLPSSGLLIWHVDYDDAVWNDNTVNNDASHPRVQLLQSTDSMVPWSGQDLGISFSQVEEIDGVIYAHITNTNILSQVLREDFKVKINGNMVSFNNGERFDVYNLSGQVVANNVSQISIPVPGIYFVTTLSTVYRISIK